MIALRLLLVIALAFTANAEKDLQLAYKLTECLQKSLTDGVPSLHIPKHNPLRIRENLSWQGDIGIASATLNVSNIVWYGIPSWNVTLDQLSNDTDSEAIFNFTVSWDKFDLTSEYTLKTNLPLIADIKGDLNVTLSGNNWKGSFNITKPGYNTTEEVNQLDLVWTLADVDFDFSGLGAFNEPVSSAYGLLLKAFFDSEYLGNTLGEALQKKINTGWFANSNKMITFLEYCLEN